MTTSAPDVVVAVAVSVRVDEDALVVELSDGRTILAPLSWYPRLVHATRAERDDVRLTGGGRGIQWPQIDEDISVASILGGRPSMERPDSLKRWLAGRAKVP